MAVLDDLSGFELEDLMEDVFRNLGYGNVRQAARTADEDRDILMEECGRDLPGDRRRVQAHGGGRPAGRSEVTLVLIGVLVATGIV